MSVASPSFQTESARTFPLFSICHQRSSSPLNIFSPLHHHQDSKDNLIKQWRRIFPQRGVVSEELQLSEQPPLGDWSITVDVQGQRYSKTFTVAEYVLPTFAVDVRLPPYATYNRSDVVATVRATYTYGKPVKGEVTLTVQPKIRHSSISFRPLEQFQTKMRISEEGSVDIPVNIVRDLNLKTG